MCWECRNCGKYPPHFACYDCRRVFQRLNWKSDYKRTEAEKIEYKKCKKCPNCGNIAKRVSWKFEAPKKRDNKAWEKLKQNHIEKASLLSYDAK